ncbi:MAG TPA: 5-formyltetrahydrofolate cyclo-ligase [Steroidobacteraceae bacterium]|nr:5-formyltetrahydrofolate cyclo-ligase [Steroidobacteraceae bacterium]
MSKAKAIRQQIWDRLRPLAKPDSRFHFDFTNVIPDFQGSEQAIQLFVSQPVYRESRYAFVTPDNGLARLRQRMLDDGKTVVVSTYGIFRGFVLLEPSRISREHHLFASWLDGLEHFGRPISLTEIRERGRFDFMATGASAVSLNGVRFGKGHGFFDLEWGMFTDIGVADEHTPVVAIVHDVQVVEEKLFPSETDILVDAISTPTRYLHVRRASRPKGVKWNLLEPEQLSATPPLQELQRMQTHGGLPR